MFDLRNLPDGFHDDPFAHYARLRNDAPVCMQPDGSVLLSRHEDLTSIYRDTARFRSDKKPVFGPKYGVGSPLFRHHTTSLVFNDPPLHTRVRAIMTGALTPRALAPLEQGLVALVDRLLDRLDTLETPDLIEDFAAAIPVEIIGNLFAIPHADRAPLRGWSLAILGALEPMPTAEQLAAGNRTVSEFLDYLRGLVADRRAYPGNPAVDVLTRLIQGEAGGAALSEAELLHNCIFILNAGHETTTNLIGNGLHALLEWPDEKRRLIAEPALIRTAIEEFLRFESSNQLGNRISTAWCEIGGLRLEPGTRITLCIGAANRDPEPFERPDVLDIARAPNRHLAFASGIHACVGMSLARLEGKVAIERFLSRFPDYELAGAPVRGGRARFRGFLSMPVRITP